MAADSERGQSCQGRASWDGRREVKGGNHPGRTTRFPSAKTQDSSGLCVRECVCVCIVVYVQLTDNNAD